MTSAIDLTQLPQPQVIETLDYEQILAEMVTQLNGLQPLLFDEGLAPTVQPAELFESASGEQYFKVPANHTELSYVELESDPSAKLLEIVAYREMILRQRINNAAYATMLAFATGADLEHEAARFGVSRLVVTPADPNAIPPVEAVMESDTSLRRRTQLALDGFSTAGPQGAYIFHALTASALVKNVRVDAPTFQLIGLTPTQQTELGADAIALEVLNDVGLVDPMPGDVAVTVLSTDGDGTADAALLESVALALDDESIRPLTDRVRVRSADVLTYSLDASLILHPGPDATLVLQAAIDAVTAYTVESAQIGLPPTQAGFYKALKQPGVYDVVINLPATQLVLNPYQAAYCDSINVVVGGVYE